MEVSLKTSYPLGNPWSSFAALTLNTHLVLELTRRDVIGWY